MRVHVGLILLLPLSVGCTNTLRHTNPPRTATEIFLHSRAAGEAVTGLGMANLAGYAVFVDRSFLRDPDDPDTQYFLGEFRAELLEHGVRLVPRERAEVIVEVRFAGLGIDRTSTFVGIPSEVIAPFVGQAVGAETTPELPPEIALYKSARQRGTGSVSYIAYFNASGELLTTSGPSVGYSDLNRRNLLFLDRTRSTVPTVAE